MPQPGRTLGSPDPPPAASISLRVNHINQLFETLDPYPFRERDLDADVEAYVVGWARSLPPDRPLTLAVHMPAAEARHEHAADVGEGFRNHFRARAELIRLDLAALLNTGQLSLVAGLGVLALTIAAGAWLSRLIPEGFAHRFVTDGLIIVGWVALWRPIDIFLFEWWPIVRKRRLYARLAQADVAIVPEPDGG